jgi:hypothetical protein
MSERQMTTAEQSIADDKMRAEIAKLIAETSKINTEARWYPLALGTGLAAALLTAGATAAKLFFGA